MTWKRFKDEENTQVFRWFQNDKGHILSVVQGYLPDEANIRMIINGQRREIRGHKSLILKETDENLIAKAERTFSFGVKDVPNRQSRRTNFVKAKNHYIKTTKKVGWFGERNRHRLAALKARYNSRQTGKTNRAFDVLYKAKLPGKRKSSGGNAYYEYRKNRSDLNQKRRL